VGQKQHYTVMIIPEDSSQVKRLLIGKKVILAAVLVGIIFLTGFFFVASFAVRQVHRLVDYEQMAQENQQLTLALMRTDARISEISERQRRNDDKIDKFRLMASVQDPERHVAIGPLSGREADMVSTTRLGDDSLMGEVIPAFSRNRLDAVVRELDLRLESLDKKSDMQTMALEDLEGILVERKSMLRSIPSIWPVHGWVTSKFGYRTSPFTGQRTLHEGLDIGASRGTAVRVPADGVVTFAGTRTGYGKFIVIDHGFGFTTRYGHNSRILVQVGDTVRRGEVVAQVGSTGRSTGPHVHYEVKLNGLPVDPSVYILEDSVILD